MEVENLKRRGYVVPVPATMEHIHTSGGSVVVQTDLDAGGSTARISILTLKTCIELYNYMVRYNKTLIYT